MIWSQCTSKCTYKTLAKRDYCWRTAISNGYKIQIGINTLSLSWPDEFSSKVNCVYYKLHARVVRSNKLAVHRLGFTEGQGQSRSPNRSVLHAVDLTTRARARSPFRLKFVLSGGGRPYGCTQGLQASCRSGGYGSCILPLRWRVPAEPTYVARGPRPRINPQPQGTHDNADLEAGPAFPGTTCLGSA